MGMQSRRPGWGRSHNGPQPVFLPFLLLWGVLIAVTGSALWGSLLAGGLLLCVGLRHNQGVQ